MNSYRRCSGRDYRLSVLSHAITTFQLFFAFFDFVFFFLSRATIDFQHFFVFFSFEGLFIRIYYLYLKLRSRKLQQILFKNSFNFGLSGTNFKRVFCIIII